MCPEVECELSSGCEGPEVKTCELGPSRRREEVADLLLIAPAGSQSPYFLLCPWGFSRDSPLLLPCLRAPWQRPPKQKEVPRNRKALINMTKALGEGEENSRSSLFPFQWVKRREGAQACSQTQRPLEDNACKSPLPSRGAEGRAREKSVLVLPGTRRPEAAS